MTTPDHDLPTLRELFARAVQERAEQVFLVTAERQQTFSETGAHVECVAAALAARGVRRGDRVAIQAANSIALVNGWLGAMRLGALPVCLNPALTRHELALALDDTEPAVLLTDAERASDAEAVAAEHGVPVARVDLVGGADDLAALDGPMPPPLPDVIATDPAMLVYTSGTTSRPKAVVVTHAALALSGEAFPSWVGLGEEERLWACLPLFHMNAQAYSLATAIAHGYSLAISSRFSASGFWKEALRLGVTAANVIGAMLEILARNPPEHWVPSRLRLLYTAPAPSPARRAELERRFHVRIASGYGMSEAPFGCIDSETSRRKVGSIGRPRLHPWRPITNELRIVDPDGRPLPVGELGELQLRNVTTSPGYWNMTDGSARRGPDGWLSTGDTGFVDADGDVMLVGRSKEMIRRRGENIAPGEIEDALMAHPGVLMAAAVGLPSELSEEDVAAAVVLREGVSIDPAELQAWCAERLASYKVPTRIDVRDALPMTPTMRIARGELAREMAIVDRGGPDGAT